MDVSGEVFDILKGVLLALRPLKSCWTGSRAMGVETMESDYDFLVLLPGTATSGRETATAVLVDAGWSHGEPYPTGPQSFRKGRVNLLVTDVSETYRKWERATELCAELAKDARGYPLVAWKPARVLIFDAICGDEPLGGHLLSQAVAF